MVPVAGLARVEPRLQLHRDAGVVQDALHHRGVAVLGHALMAVGEVVVVVVEAQRQALEDARRQVGGLRAPLLARVAGQERLVELAPDEAEALLLEGPRLLDGGVREPLDERASLRRPHRGPEELVDRVQVDRQRVDGALRRRLDPVLVGPEPGVGVHVVPDLVVVGVEDVRAEHVDQHAGRGVPLGMAVAGDMGARLADGDGVPRLGQRPGDHGARQAGADDHHFGHVPLPRVRPRARIAASPAGSNGAAPSGQVGAAPSGQVGAAPSGRVGAAPGGLDGRRA